MPWVTFSNTDKRIRGGMEIDILGHGANAGDSFLLCGLSFYNGITVRQLATAGRRQVKDP
jgi:hypothetical protein